MEKFERLKLTVYSDQHSITFSLLGEKDCLSLKADRKKIYLIKRGVEFIYVGEAHCDLKSRISRSLTSVRSFIKHGKARNGYKGYKWLHDCRGRAITFFDLYIYIFPQGYDEKKERWKVEAVEGELVFLIRNKSGKWPLFQNEIHFSNYENGTDTANKIFESTTLKETRL